MNLIVGEFVIISANCPLSHNPYSFRMIPTFGRDTIRRFTSNTSELKKMAARNYEDFLQVSHVLHIIVHGWIFTGMASHLFGSALSQFLKAYCQNPIMGISFDFCSLLLTGMD
jgi:hypothetical protein